MSTIDVASGDSVVVDILFRELANAREQLHNSFDDADAYVDLVKRFKQKTASSTSKPDLSTAYLETLGQFNDGRIPGNSASSSLQVTRELTRLENEQFQVLRIVVAGHMAEFFTMARNPIGI